jgi:hypothetical protein
MNDSAKNFAWVTQNSETRKHVIETLYPLFGEPATIEKLRANLRLKAFGGFSMDEIKKAVRYLAGRGKEYIDVTPVGEKYGEWLVELTPRGVDLAEGRIEDIGVVIGE